ncbi:Uncharacterised protein r2_g774 [Pycnogonum litorale]
MADFGTKSFPSSRPGTSDNRTGHISQDQLCRMLDDSDLDLSHDESNNTFKQTNQLVDDHRLSSSSDEADLDENLVALPDNAD